jgi:hypothetical protein
MLRLSVLSYAPPKESKACRNSRYLHSVDQTAVVVFCQPGKADLRPRSFANIEIAGHAFGGRLPPARWQTQSAGQLQVLDLSAKPSADSVGE